MNYVPALFILIGVVLTNACNNDTQIKDVEPSKDGGSGIVITPKISLDPVDSVWTLISTDRYELKGPIAWELEKLTDQTIIDGVEFGFIKSNENEESKFHEQFNLWSSIIPFKVNLEDYIRVQIKQHEMYTQGFVLNKSTSIPDDSTGRMLIYSSKWYEFNIKTIVGVWSTSDRLYTLSFNVLDQDFDRYEGMGMEIISSFKLLN